MLLLHLAAAPSVLAVYATAAFGMELLRGKGATGDPTIGPGVWYPAELQADARSNILAVARQKTLVWEV